MNTIDKHKDKVILIPDGEHPFLMRVVHCLVKIKQLKVVIMSNTRHFPMRYSRYIKNIKFVTYKDELGFINCINEIVSSDSVDVIMPISEEGITSIIKHQDLIVAKEKLVYLSDMDTYIHAKDKSKLYRHLLLNKIPHPKTTIYNTSDDKINIEPLDFPIIAKPAIGYGGEGIEILKNIEEVKNFEAKKKSVKVYVLQEFIEGYDIDCSLLCNDGKIKAYTIQKGILFGNQKYAPAIGLQFLINDRLLEVVKQLMESLKWSGVAHIDLRYDKETSDYKVIEINGRFWSSLDASAAAGVNFPYLYSLKEDELLKSKILYKEIQYLNLKGLLKTVVKKPQLIFMYKYLKNNTALPLLISDPMPSVIMLLNKLKQIFRFV